VNLTVLNVTASDPAQCPQALNVGSIGFGQCGCDLIGGVTYRIGITFESATTGTVTIVAPNGMSIGPVAFTFTGSCYDFGSYGLDQTLDGTFDDLPADSIVVNISSPTLASDFYPLCTNKGCAQNFIVKNQSSLTL